MKEVNLQQSCNLQSAFPLGAQVSLPPQQGLGHLLRVPRKTRNMANTELVIDVEEADFQRAVIDASRTRPVIVDFWAPWCAPCRLLTPVLEQLVRQRLGDILLAKVNIDDNQNLAYQFGVQAVPMVLAFRDGKMVADFVGLLSEEQLGEFIDGLCPSAADRAARQGVELEKTEPVRAEQLYRQALAQDRRQETAIVGLARLLIAQNQNAEAKELLEEVGPGSDQGEEAERLTAILALRELAGPLGDETTARQRVQAEPKNAQARYELGCILAAANQYAEALAILLEAAEANHQLATGKAREAMVKIFQVVGLHSDLANDYRDKLSGLLY